MSSISLFLFLFLALPVLVEEGMIVESCYGKRRPGQDKRRKESWKGLARSFTEGERQIHAELAWSDIPG